MSEDVVEASPLLRYEPPASDRTPSWQALLDEPLRSEALAAVFCVAERMRDPATVLDIAQRAQEQSTQQHGWSPLSLCGIAMFYSHMSQCFPEQGWDVVAQCHLQYAASWTQKMPFITPGLFGGTCSLVLPLQWLSEGGTRYQKTLTHIRQMLCEQIFERKWRRAEEEGGVADSDYDIISGAAGTLAGLLLLEAPNDQETRAIELLLAYLTWLAAPGQSPGKEHWYAPPALLPTEHHRKIYPEGCLNCGLAHGIAGPLATLSLAWQSGYRYPGLQEAIRFLSNWLLLHQISDSWGCSWPPVIPRAASFAAKQWQAVPGTHAGWCYGSPGIAYSLWWAGEALADENLRQKSQEALEATLRRPPSERRLYSPTLCHGKAGLLLICLHLTHVGASTLIREQIPVLAEQVLASFNPDTPLGFQDMEGPVVAVDQPNWLTGAPGVALALLAAATDVFPTWDRMLLLS